ncbi:hypothetical protein ACFVGM_05455 [Kitasatospora purpeofusca]|uniref:hypothetical protein n=1 Tax=Kitasatospora purpeofusca TaxID=67352 RepID=UPI0036897272
MEVTVSEVRRRRAGHIELAAPMVHPWYRDRLCEALELDGGILADIVHERCHVVRVGDRERFVRPPAGEESRLDDGSVRTGAEAVRLMFARRGQEPPRGALLSRLPVLPADLRPVFVHEGRLMGSALNNPYRQVVLRASRLRRLIALGAPAQVTGQERVRLQAAVDALLGPSVSGEATLADRTTILPGRHGGLRDRFFDRPADFSARTTVVAETTGDLDAVLLPDRIAWTLLEPVLMAKLVGTGGSPNVAHARKEVRDRSPLAWAGLRAVCQDTVPLVSVPGTGWPLFAARVARLTGDLSLKLDPGLFDHLGWDRLGSQARIFPLMSVEAAAQARASSCPAYCSAPVMPGVATSVVAFRLPFPPLCSASPRSGSWGRSCG